jgi:hypothetical protein
MDEESMSSGPTGQGAIRMVDGWRSAYIVRLLPVVTEHILPNTPFAVPAGEN